MVVFFFQTKGMGVDPPRVICALQRAVTVLTTSASEHVLQSNLSINTNNTDHTLHKNAAHVTRTQALNLSLFKLH